MEGARVPLPSGSPQDAAAFAAHAPSLADPTFIRGELPTTAATSAADSQDERPPPWRSRARLSSPFLGVRAVSDGGGDPLHLPGFPYQFFVYRSSPATTRGGDARVLARVDIDGSPTADSKPKRRRPRHHRARRHRRP